VAEEHNYRCTLKWCSVAWHRAKIADYLAGNRQTTALLRTPDAQGPLRARRVEVLSAWAENMRWFRCWTPEDGELNKAKSLRMAELESLKGDAA
jgi:hypothetical protein